MDNLVLTTVALALDHRLRDASLRDLRQDSRNRFRFLWSVDGGTHASLVSMRPESPWIATPSGRGPGRSTFQGGFASRLRKTLVGARLASVTKPTSDRWLEMRFMDGRCIVLELALHRANIIELDADGRVVSSLRRPRSAAPRIEVRHRYTPPVPPANLLDPSSACTSEIDDLLNSPTGSRRLFGVGAAAARLVRDEASATGESSGTILAARLRQLGQGLLEPVIEAPEQGDLGAGELLPWQPAREPLPGRTWLRGVDAADTAGRWYDTLDLDRQVGERRRALRRIVHRESLRNRQATSACESDLRGFEDPDRYRLWAEAILAGLSHAERIGQEVRVPNPADPESGDYVIPVPPGVPLPRVAAGLFTRHRRAVRGLGLARHRLDDLERRGRALGDLELRFDGDGALDDLIESAKRLGLAVGLGPDTRAGREAALREAPRLEGVRVYYASTGELILAGKGAKANHRLTFKLAAPHDFWLHAAGVPGAHVVLRNDARDKRPGPALAEAAAVAAHHSDAARESRVDVQWTLRKNVRKPRGAAPGTVVLKRFETIRVRPGTVSRKPGPVL